MFGGFELAQALRIGGDVREADAVLATTRDVAHATRLDDVARNIEQVLSRPPSAGDSSGVTLAPRTRSAEPIKGRGR